MSENLIKNGSFEQWTPGQAPALVFKPTVPPALYTTGNLPVPWAWVVYYYHGDFGPIRFDQPETKPMKLEEGYQARIHTGTRSFCMFGFFRRINGGLYQVVDVPGHGPATVWLRASTLWTFKHNDAYWDGVEARVVDGVLTVTAWAHAWSNHDDRARVPGHEDCCDSPHCSWGVGYEAVAIMEGEAPPLNGDSWNDAVGNFTFQVGISLDASLDPADAVWGQGKHIYNGFAPVAVSVPLDGSQPTPPPDPVPDPDPTIYNYPEQGSKLGIHTIRSNNVAGFVQAALDGGARLPVVKAVDDFGTLHVVKQMSPETITVARVHYGGEALSEQYLAGDPRKTAEWVMGHTIAKLQHHGDDVDYWEPTNETLPPGPDGYKRFAEIHFHMMDIAEKEGFKITLFTCNAGTPEWDEMVAMVETGVFGRAKQGGHILCLHEGVFGMDPVDKWWGDTIPGSPVVAGAGALCFRYRYLYHLLEQRDEVIPLVVSEIVFGGGYSQDGTRAEEVVRRARWYDERAREDYYVWAFLPYTLGPTAGWTHQDYEFAYPALVDYCLEIKDEPNALAPVAPEPTPEPEPVEPPEEPEDPPAPPVELPGCVPEHVASALSRIQTKTRRMKRMTDNARLRISQAWRGALRRVVTGWQWVQGWAERNAAMLRLASVGLLVVIAGLLVALALRPVEVVNVTPLVAGAQSIGTQGGVGSTRQTIDGPAIDEIVASLGFGSGNAYFVSTDGSDSNACTSWSQACASGQHVLDTHVISGNNDVIYYGGGVYDEPLVVAKTRLSIVGTEPNVSLENTTPVNGAVISITNTAAVFIRNLSIFKNDFLSQDSYGIYARNVGTVFLSDLNVVVPFFAPGPTTGPHTGVWVENGTGVVIEDVNISGVPSVPFQVGSGVVFSNTAGAAIGGESSIARLGVGVWYRGGTNEVPLLPGVSIVNNAIGVRLDPGVTDNVIRAGLADNGVNYENNSGDPSNNFRLDPGFLFDEVTHSGRRFACDPISVDGVNGDDTQNGQSTLEAVQTIERGLELAGNGDCLYLESDGTYVITGTGIVTVTQNALRMFSEQGCVISGTVIIAGDNVEIEGPLRVQNARGPALVVTGDDVLLSEISVIQATTAFSITGARVDLRSVRASGYSVAGYNFSTGAASPRVDCAQADGGGASVVGFHMSSPDVDSGCFRDLGTVGNATHGYSITLGADGNSFIGIRADRSTDGADTGVVWQDVNLGNSRIDYRDKSDFSRNEQVYPAPLGDGTPAPLPIFTSAAAQWTWGPSDVIADVNEITSSYTLIGFYTEAGSKDIRIEYECAIVAPQFSAIRDGGNVWGIGETILTIEGPLQLEVGDRVWIRDAGGGSSSEFNVVRAVTGTTEIRIDPIVVGYAGNPSIFLAARPSAGVRTYSGYISEDNTKSGDGRLSIPRSMIPGSGIACHAQNASSALPADLAMAVLIER